MTTAINTNTASSTSAVAQSAVNDQTGMTPVEMNAAIKATLAKLFDTMCEVRNTELSQSNTQEVNSWNLQVSAFDHQRESASKTMKSSLLSGAGDVLGGIVSMGCSFGGHAASKGIGKAERSARKSVLETAENLSGDDLNHFMAANEKKLNPHSNLGILGQSGEAVGGLFSSPFSIGSSIVGSGAKKDDSVADLDKSSSSNSLSDAKRYQDQGKETSGDLKGLVRALGEGIINMNKASTPGAA